jgi:hypothetical protein
MVYGPAIMHLLPGISAPETVAHGTLPRKPSAAQAGRPRDGPAHERGREGSPPFARRQAAPEAAGLVGLAPGIRS